VFRVRTSIKNYRSNPAWTYEKSGQGCLDALDRTGHPFSYGTRGNDAYDLLQGTIEGGTEVTFFHHVAWVPGTLAGTGKNGLRFSIAILTLPESLPATTFSTPFSRPSQPEGSALPRPVPTALPPAAGQVHELPNGDPASPLRGCSVDLEFATLIDTPQMRHLIQDRDLGWRIDGNRIIGWLPGRRTYEEMISMAETLAAITSDFPKEAWEHRAES
jgi:hypothetical protein